MSITVLGGFGVGKTILIDRAPEAGETANGGIYSEGPGGKGSNQAVQIARLDAPVSLITAVGSDPAGSRGFELWQAEGVNADSVIVKDAPTMVGFIIVDATGENRIALAPGALDAVTVQEIEDRREVLESSDLAVVSFELNPEAALAALRIAHRAGVRTVCNPAPAIEIPADMFGAIDVLVPNYGEACLLAGIDSATAPSPESLASALRDKGASAVVITLGSRGALVDDGNSVTHIESVTVDHVVDTTGAGDSFVGALSTSLYRGESLELSAGFATRVAARTVMTKEVIPALPYAHDLAGVLP